ncbi:hypothetical protein FGIG_06208 [Fasciola gigantica]|uniref:Uncharacterized protein n=1 Tax=Fasciola gigantica TaxID=46835 RepID=A0A504Z4L1_FASGI|nr:hypothetical protein FGIG_06208 [Fasciola gigantica]
MRLKWNRLLVVNSNYEAYRPFQQMFSRSAKRSVQKKKDFSDEQNKKRTKNPPPQTSMTSVCFPYTFYQKFSSVQSILYSLKQYFLSLFLFSSDFICVLRYHISRFRTSKKYLPRSSAASTLQFTLIGTSFDTIQLRCDIANAQELSSGSNVAQPGADLKTGIVKTNESLDSSSRSTYMNGIPRAQKIDMNIHCEFYSQII